MPRAAASVTDRPPQRPLNRDVILDGAVALIEGEGPGALSMRRLGATLGVEAMAIYHHFDSRDELLTAIGDRLLRPLHELEGSNDWREACRRFATALRDIAVAQPATFQLLGLQPFDTPVSLAPVERLLDVLVGTGSGRRRRWRSTAPPSATPAATHWPRRPDSPSTRHDLRPPAAGAAAPREFPILAGRAAELATLDADAAYELGLQALLTGLADPDRLVTAGPEAGQGGAQELSILRAASVMPRRQYDHACALRRARSRRWHGENPRSAS